MTTTPGTPADLRRRGLEALLKALGPVDYLRFVRDYLPSHGDYTQDRREWLDSMTLEDFKALLEDLSERKDTG